MHLKLTKIDGSRAICVTSFGHTIDTRRLLFPRNAAVGEAFTVTLNADADGLDVVPICDKAWRQHRRKVEETRKTRRKYNGKTDTALR